MYTLTAGPEVTARTLAGSKPRLARNAGMFTAVWKVSNPWSDTTMMLLLGPPAGVGAHRLDDALHGPARHLVGRLAIGA